MTLNKQTIEWVSDEKGRREFRRLARFVDCPNCDDSLEIEALTNEWAKVDGRWVHISFGPADGMCHACGAIIVETSDGWLVGTLSFKFTEVKKP